MSLVFQRLANSMDYSVTIVNSNASQALVGYRMFWYKENN